MTRPAKAAGGSTVIVEAVSVVTKVALLLTMESPVFRKYAERLSVVTWLAVTVTVGEAALEAVELAADDTMFEAVANGVVDAATELVAGATTNCILKEYVLPVVGEKAVTATVTVVPAAEAGGFAVMVVPDTVTQLVFVL